jgi:thiosulfate dehydrogenase
MPVAVLYFRGLVEHQLVNAAIVPLFAVVALAVMSAIQVRSQSPAWTVPEVGALPRDARGLQVCEGRDLITATYAYIGPDVPDVSKRYAGNNLACTNCHLQAGTKKFGIPLFGLYGDFPKYSARTGGEISIEERIDSCMTRSMNGRVLPNDTPEMLAIVLYIKFLSSGVAPKQELPGLGAGHMPELARAADPKLGQPLFANTCEACNNTDGSGLRRSIAGTDLGYLMPPLWGPDTFNDGAGMARLITFANFIHFNMPHGTDYWIHSSASGMRGTSQPMYCRIRGRIWPALSTTFELRNRPGQACRSIGIGGTGTKEFGTWTIAARFSQSAPGSAGRSTFMSCCDGCGSSVKETGDCPQTRTAPQRSAPPTQPADDPLRQERHDQHEQDSQPQ